MTIKKIKLNSNQKKAIDHDHGALLVVAGAGTGKTRVITEKIKHLIGTETVKPSNILALTFTEKAASEMKMRLDETMPLGYEEPWVQTFHSFCDRILREEGIAVGLDASYTIMTSAQQWALIRQHLFEFDLKYYRPLGNPTKFISALLTWISRLQDENISIDDFKAYAHTYVGDSDEKLRLHELLGVYEKYTELKLKYSKMDFGDLIAWTINLFSMRPAILSKYKDQFTHVLVDEFQDTNVAQYKLIKMLCPFDKLDSRSLTVVGDDSQSIYKFRGAAVSNILEFKRDYPDSTMITLLENYRSSQSILDASYNLIQNNNPDTLEAKLGVSKKLISMGEHGSSEIQAVLLPTEADEIEYVIQKIYDLLGKEPNLSYKDIAILTRANNQLDAFMLEFRKRELPYQLIGNRGLYDQDEIKDVVAILKVVINPYDATSLYRVLNIDAFEISPALIAKILGTTKQRRSVSMYDVCMEYITATKDANLNIVFKHINAFQNQITKKGPVAFVYELMHEINYVAQFVQTESLESKLKLANLNLFLDIIKRFEIDYKADNGESPTIVEFLQHYEIMREAHDNPAQAEIEDYQTIKLLTVHSSKGLEFPVVFMPSLVNDRFPSRNRSDIIEVPSELVSETLPEGDPHIQEERRLFYVGLTRAQKYLFLTGAKNYGGKRDKKISNFVLETKIPLEELTEFEKSAQNTLFGIDSSYRKVRAIPVDKFIPDWGISYSGLSTYIDCPLKYKYSYVLSIPTPPNHALEFGNAIHTVLKDFNSKLVAGITMPLSEMLAIYENNWNKSNFLTREHQEYYFEHGKEILKKYYEDNETRKGAPYAIERRFQIKVGDIKLTGRIDRIDMLPDGTVEIIDYKTGQSKKQADIDKDMQLSVYALGVKEALNMDASALSLYFVEDGQKVSTTRTPAQLEETKDSIISLTKRIQTGEFTATPGRHCAWCDYKEICPFADKNA